MGYVTLIFAVSSVSHLPGPDLFPHVDKVAHFVEYAILGFLIGRAFRRAAPIFIARYWLGLAIIAAVAIGLLDEAFQSTVPGREPSRYDFLADVAGAAAGQLALLRGGKPWKKGEKQRESSR